MPTTSRILLGLRCEALESRSSSAVQYDRDVTVSRALERLAVRPQPLVVETGCVRSPEDWGAGYFGYVVGAWLCKRRGGHLISIDNNLEHLATARHLLQHFAGFVELVHEDSAAWLRRNGRPVDLLYLDSLDTDDPRHAEHCLDEAVAAAPALKAGSLLLIDDTPWDSGGWTGKGRRAVPWLLEHGWRIVEGGYQTLLERAETGPGRRSSNPAAEHPVGGGESDDGNDQQRPEALQED